MKAAVYYGIEDIKIEERDIPELHDNEALLKPHYCGICGSDLSAWKYGTYDSGVIIGHEFSAEVVDVGAKVTKWRKGDRVVVNSVIPCKKCYYCNHGKYSLCDDLLMPGITIDGGCAEFAVMPEDALLTIPSKLSWKAAALVEPLAVVLHGFNMISFKPGMTALVLGAGPIGLLATQVVVASGASQVAVSEPNEYRRELAKKSGASVIIDPLEADVSLTLEKEFGREGADLVIETTGNAEVASESTLLAKKGGTVLVLGIPAEPVEIDFMGAVLNELNLHFSYCGYSEFPEAIKLLTNKIIKADQIITKEIPLEALIDEGFKFLTGSNPSAGKVVVKLD